MRIYGNLQFYVEKFDFYFWQTKTTHLHNITMNQFIIIAFLLDFTVLRKKFEINCKQHIKSKMANGNMLWKQKKMNEKKSNYLLLYDIQSGTDKCYCYYRNENINSCFSLHFIEFAISYFSSKRQKTRWNKKRWHL